MNIQKSVLGSSEADKREIRPSQSKNREFIINKKYFWLLRKVIELSNNDYLPTYCKCKFIEKL